MPNARRNGIARVAMQRCANCRTYDERAQPKLSAQQGIEPAQRFACSTQPGGASTNSQPTKRPSSRVSLNPKSAGRTERLTRVSTRRRIAPSGS